MLVAPWKQRGGFRGMGKNTWSPACGMGICPYVVWVSGIVQHDACQVVVTPGKSALLS